MRSPVKYLLAVLVASIVASSSSVGAVQEVTLRYKWTKGETLRYRLTQQSTSNISGLPGDMGEMTVEQTVAEVLRETVDDVAADGTTTVRATFESFNVDMSSPMGRMGYDTAKPEATDPGSVMLKSIFAAVVGESFTVVLTPTGAVQRVEGLSKISEKMFANLPPEAAPMLGGLRQGMSDETMKMNMAQTLATFPERPLKPSDTWNDKTTTVNPMMGPITISSVSTLKALEGAADKQVATITSTLTIQQDSTAPGAGPMGMTVKMDEAKGDRVVLFNVGQGRTQKVTTNLATPMTISGTTPDGTALNMKSATKGVITLELLQP